MFRDLEGMRLVAAGFLNKQIASRPRQKVAGELPVEDPHAPLCRRARHRRSFSRVFTLGAELGLEKGAG